MSGTTERAVAELELYLTEVDEDARVVRVGPAALLSSRRRLLGVLVVTFVAVVAWRVGWTAELPAFAAFAVVLAAVVAVDLCHQEVLVRLLGPATVFGALALGTTAAVAGGEVDQLLGAGLGAAVFWAALRAAQLVAPHGPGPGDVRLAVYVGMHLGWLGLPQVMVGLLSVFVLSFVVGLVLMAVAFRRRHDVVPFGPVLVAAALVALAVGGSPVLWSLPALTA